MNLFKKLKKQNKEFRKGFNPFEKTGCCGGRQNKQNKYKDTYYSLISEDDPTNF